MSGGADLAVDEVGEASAQLAHLEHVVSALRRGAAQVAVEGLVAAGEGRAALLLVEQARRAVDALAVALVGEVERSASFRSEGFRSPASYVAHVCRVSGGEATRLVRAGRALGDLPLTAAAHRDGELSGCALDVIAQVHANPRVRDQLPAAEADLVADARRSSVRDFRQLAMEWARLADADGSLASTERHHTNRRASMHQDFDGSWVLSAAFGAAQGAAIAEVLARYERAELEADWDKARAEHGDRATVAHLPRSAQQRRADALWAVFLDAAAKPADSIRPEPLVNIVITLPEWEEALARATGAPPPESSASPPTRRCSTLEGHLLAPAEAVAAAFVGQVRRVVIDSAGVVIDLGRKCRLYADGARDAALIANSYCVWPGCDQHGSACQIDHLVEWQDGGPTDQDNAGVLCAFHNRWKTTNRYRVVRDPDGTWHTYKPDGTELQ